MTDQDAKIATAIMAHHSYSHGRASIVDADLIRLLDIYGEDMRPVFEELQFLRHEVERLEFEVANID